MFERGKLLNGETRVNQKDGVGFATKGDVKDGRSKCSFLSILSILDFDITSLLYMGIDEE